MTQVLVVDDTKNIRSLLTKCLESAGYSVKTAVDGRAALEILERERFGLVFLDIKMPLFSGTEVLKKMRETGINTPVVVITAYATVKNAVDCTNLGAVAYLQKPFTADKVRAVLKEALHFEPQKSELENRLLLVQNRLENSLFGEAEELLKRALSDHPLCPELYRLLAEAADGLGDASSAEKYRRIYQTLNK